MQQTTLEKAQTETYRDLGAHIRTIVAGAPTRRALTHLVKGEHPGATLTYAALDRAARSVAALLQARKAQGERALMLFNAGIDSVTAFLGCLYARVVAVPLPAPFSGRVHRYLPRVEAVVKDANVRFVMTTSDILRQLQELAAKIPAFREVEWIAMDSLPDRSEEWKREAIQDSDLCYLQYTSGSTSTPKGVMISHGNLMRICEYDSRLLDLSPGEHCAICWMPYFHDYGLIEGVLVPLFNGYQVYIMSPLDFVQNPIRWLNAINRYRATVSSGPNFAFELCVRKSTPQQRAVLDLSCWRTASCAAEPINSGTVKRFLDSFVPCGFHPEAFYPAWGLAEATLLVTGKSGAVFYDLDAAKLEQDRIRVANGSGPFRTMTGCGIPLSHLFDVDVRIVNPETFLPSAPEEVGEIWVGGGLVAQGYWNRPEETAAIFHAQIHGVTGKKFMRTGDLGFIAGDELVFTGRRKDLIIVEGRNHYPQDIEKTAEASHPALRPGCSIAFSLEQDGEVRVVLVAELNKEYGIEGTSGTGEAQRIVSRREVEAAIRMEVSEDHQIRVHHIELVQPNTIPKTSSGKLQRSACRQKFLSGDLQLCK